LYTLGWILVQFNHKPEEEREGRGSDTIIMQKKYK
jgi:hypothetical protein